MEAGSLGLSVLTLFIECLQAYKLFSAAHCLNSDLRTLKTKFQIEETRLTQWGFYWGYRSSPTEECTLDATVDSAGQNVATTVKLTLQQISTLLKKYDAVSAKYDANSSGGPGQAYRGMVWAIKDKATLESTIQNLMDFNNGLHQLLPRKSETSLVQVMACALARGNDGGDLDDVIAAAASLQYTDAAKLARFKKAYQMLEVAEEQQLPHPSMQSSALQLDASMFELSIQYASADRTFAKFKNNGQHVIIEWKSYPPSLLSGSQTAQMTLHNRVSHLAELMSHRTQRPEGFNILFCAGYFDQTPSECFGFVYDFPPNVFHSMPFTLHQLLKGLSIPPLGTRFKLALSLSRTLNLLHASGWLHKSISSNNIAIFQAAETFRPEFERPYLLGFGYSRPDEYGEETFGEQSAVTSMNNLYRHPEVQGQHPRRCMASDDLYSLGLVLLEIAEWRPLTDIEGTQRTSSTSQAPLDIEKIKVAVSGLPGKVGTIYKEVVKKCLTFSRGNTQEMSSHSAAGWNMERLRSQNRFYWDVVKRLEECKA